MNLRFVGSLTVRPHKGEEFHEQFTAEELPLSKQRIDRLVGDGLSKASVGVDLKDRDMGAGFGAFASVTLTCDSDPAVVAEALDLCEKLARGACTEAFHGAAADWVEAIEKSRQGL